MSKILRSSLIKPLKNGLSCDLAGEAVLLNLKSGVYFGLNVSGARAWNLIQKKTTIACILEAYLEEYDVDPARGERDLYALIEDLRSAGFVEIQN